MTLPMTIVLYSLGIIPGAFIIISIAGLLCIIFTCKFIRKHNHTPLKQTYLLGNGTLFKLFLSLFVVSTVINLIVIYVYPTLPTIYYLLVLLSVALLLLSLIHSQSKIQIISVIVSALYLACITSLSFFRNTFWTGGDMGYHARIGNYIVTTGYYLSDFFGKEYPNPLYHITNAITEIFTLLDIRTSTIIAVYVPLILLSIIIYLIVRDIVGNRFAIVSLITFNFFPIVLQWRTLDYSTAYGILSFFTLFYLVYFLLFKSDKIRIIILLFIVTFASICSHLFSSVLICAIISIFCTISIFLFPKTKWNALKTLSIYPISLLVYSYISGSLNQIIPSIVSVFSISSAASSKIVSKISSADWISSFEYILHHIPMTVLLSTATFLIAILLCISTVSASSYNLQQRIRMQWLFLLTGGAVIFLFVVAGAIMTMMSDRFGVYVSFFTAILISFSFWHILSRNKIKGSTRGKYVFMFGVILVISFIGITSPCVTPDNNIWLKDSYEHLTMTYNEKESVNTLTLVIPDDTGRIIFAERDRPINLIWDINHLSKDTSIVPHINIYGGFSHSTNILNIEGKLDWAYLLVREERLLTYPYYNSRNYSNKIIEISQNNNEIYDSSSIICYRDSI